MKIIIDYETRSPVDIKKHGAFVYAAHPLTQPVCLAFAIDNASPVIWVDDYFKGKINTKRIEYRIISETDAVSLLNEATEIIAQNSIFEFIITKKIMYERRGWPKPQLNKYHDIMAQLAYHALPMNLEQAALALNLPMKKDAQGHSVMMKISKPRNPRKAEREADPLSDKLYWHEDPVDIETVVNYCGRDVEVERMVHKRLAPLPPMERQVWLLDQQINLRGVHVDQRNIRAIVETLNTQEDKLLSRFAELVNNEVSGPRSYVSLRNWINKKTGLKLTSLDKAATEKLLKAGNLPAYIKEILQIKSELSKSSVAKFQAMLDRSNKDNRVRGWSAYHAAGTGRWGAWGLQLHNNPRDCYDPGDYEAVCRLFIKQDVDGIKLLWDDPHFVASRCIRGALTASPGNVFFCTDFSAIEGRGLAYLANEEWVLQAYRNDEDMYKHAAAELFNVPYDQVGKQQRQIGKVEELMLGYAGGIGAFFTGAKGYGIDLETLPALILSSATIEEVEGPYGAKALASMFLKNNPGAMSLDAAVACDIIKRRWRAKRPRITSFWKSLEEAAICAIENPGCIYAVGKLRYCFHDQFLKCQLPSGRVMHYYLPRISYKETEWGESKAVSYMGMKIVDGKTTRQWVRVFTYSGKLAENVTQAFCRDLLAEAMLRHEAAGYPIVLHVHDEDVAERKHGGSIEEFNRIAEIVPSWAKGMPIKADGWVGKRYRK